MPYNVHASEYGQTLIAGSILILAGVIGFGLYLWREDKSSCYKAAAGNSKRSRLLL